MNPVFAIFDPYIIDQTLAATLAAIRAPAFLPDALNAELFENHFLTWIGCIIAAFIFTKMGNVRRQRSLVQIGVSTIMITLLWMLAANIVDTPGERLDLAHRRLLAAAIKKDIPAIRNALDPTFRFGPLDRDGLALAADASLKTFTIQRNTITKYEPRIEHPLAQSNISVVSQITGAGPIVTRWKLQWEDDPTSDWRLTGIITWYLNDQEQPANGTFPKGP